MQQWVCLGERPWVQQLAGGGCWWCQSRELQERIGYGAAIASLVLLSTVVPVQIFHSKLKKEHRRLTEFEYELAPPEYSQYRY